MNELPDSEVRPDALRRPDPGVSEQLAGIEESLQRLRYVLQVAMGATILLVAAVNVFMWHQVGLVHRQASELNAGAVQLSAAVADYQTNSVPLMQSFAQDLFLLARTDTNLAAVIAKYPLPRARAATSQTAPITPPSTATPPPQ